MTEKKQKNLPIDKAEYDALVKECLRIIADGSTQTQRRTIICFM